MPETPIDINEKCDLFPSLRRIECSHCQGTAPGTRDNPRFSIEEGFDSEHGYPIVKVLKNGGPVHRFDQNFRFGRGKAVLMLACLESIHDFAYASVAVRLAFQPRVLIDPNRTTRISIYVEPHQYFDYSTGSRVNEPWLWLKTIPSEKPRIGLGAIKCRAIWELRDELKAWVARQPG
jgi:hypothetical protein